MKKLTQAILDSYSPCYPAKRFYDKNYVGNVLQLAKDVRIPFEDRLWVIMRAELVSEKFARLFAVWCAKQVAQNNKDPRVKAARVAAVKYAFGEITLEALNTAQSAADCAAWSAARSAAEYAARSAARSAADFAARSAARSAADFTAWSAARSAVDFAAWSAFWSASLSASLPDSLSAARSAQEKQLIKMIEAGIITGDVK